jgi:amino acid transporter
VSTSETTSSAAGAEPAEPTEKSQLKKNSLGVWEIAFFVIAASAPVFVINVAFTTYVLGGIGAPAGYLIGGFFLLFFAMAFTAMSKYIKNAGAFYAYISRGLGKLVGGGSAYVALFSYSIESIGFYGAFAYFAQFTFNDLFGINVPWQIWIFVMIAVIALLGHRSVNVGANVLLVFLSAEVVILAVLSIAVLIKEPGHISIQPFMPSNVFVPGIAAILIFGFGAFTGFESTAIYSEEARNPDRTIPIATYVAVGFLALFYAFTVWIATVAFGLQGVMDFVSSDKASDLYFTMSQNFLGHWAYIVMRILILTSIIACNIGFHNAVSRYGFALGREGLLPKYLGRSHPKFKSPYMASATQIVIAVILCVLVMVLGGDPYIHLFIWTYAAGVTGLVLMQFLAALAVLGYFWRDQRGYGIFRVKVAPIIGAIGLGGSYVLILTNYSLMTGYTSTISNIPFILYSPIAFVLGLIIAYRMKVRNPDGYKLLATDYH